MRRLRSGPLAPRALRLLALLVGGLALYVMAGAVVADRYYDEGDLPPGGELACVAGTAAWLGGLGLSLAGHAPRAVTALGATPALLLAVWLAFLD